MVLSFGAGCLDYVALELRVNISYNLCFIKWGNSAGAKGVQSLAIVNG